MKRVSYLLLGMLIPMLFVNCTGKNGIDEADNLLHVQLPSIQKFVVITADEALIYREADTSSPTLVMDVEDCECDMPDYRVQWSNQPVPSGFSRDPNSLPAGQAAAVVGEEGDFYVISTLSEYSDVETGYILKSATEDMKPEPITAEIAEGIEWAPTLVVKEGKYKDLVLRSVPNDLEGETLQVGLLIDGVLAFPMNYVLDIWQQEDVKGFVMQEEESYTSFVYSPDLVYKSSEGYILGLDPKKLNEEQIALIFEHVVKEKPQRVGYEYYFPMLEWKTPSFYFDSKIDVGEGGEEIEFTTCQRQEDGDNYSSLDINLDVPVGDGDVQRNVTKGIRTICNNSAVAEELGTAPADATIEGIADFYVKAFQTGQKAETIYPMCTYSLGVSKKLLTKTGVVFHVVSGVWGNGGPWEFDTFVRFSDGAVLETKDLIKATPAQLKPIVQKYAPEEIRDMVSLEEGEYQLMPAPSGGINMHVAMGSHFFAEFEIPRDELSAYFTEAGKVVYGAE